MKRLTTIAALAASLIAPAGALAIPADTHVVAGTHAGTADAVQASASSGFDWSSAAVGGASVLALIVLATALFIVVAGSHRRHGSIA